MKKNNVLIIYAHPFPNKSKVNKAMMRAISDIPQVAVNDLYERYPDFHIDIPYEQNLLKTCDLLILHFPIYWFSSPAIIKEWKYAALEFGFAHGEKGNALRGKKFMLTISAAGLPDAYQRGGINHFTLEEFLRPFEQTAAICGMQYWPPFVLQGTPHLTDQQIQDHAQRYKEFLLSVVQNTNENLYTASKDNG